MRNRDWGGKLGKIVIRAIVRMMTMMMIMVMRTKNNGGNKGSVQIIKMEI